MKRIALFGSAALASTAAVPMIASAQDLKPDLSGMWSDPPLSADAIFCFNACTREGLGYLHQLLDDPANRERSTQDLIDEATRYQTGFVESRYLTSAALIDYPPDLANDPGLVSCEPWGFARQVLAPHQLEIRQYEDRIEMHYAEWSARRSVYLHGYQAEEPSETTAMGHSIARYEDGALVVETSNIDAGLSWAAGVFEHSDQLTAIERYTRPDPNTLHATVVFEDPVTLKEPLSMIKSWRWAPDEEIFEYECSVDP